MNNIFEIFDKTKRKVYLTYERYKHIISEHPEVTNHIETMKETLNNPTKITYCDYDENIRYYYNTLHSLMFIKTSP